MSLWLALRFPQLMIDALSSADSNAPLAVREQQRLVAVNTAAATQGVRTGMKVGTALALCDALPVLERQPAAETRFYDLSTGH